MIARLASKFDSLTSYSNSLALWVYLLRFQALRTQYGRTDSFFCAIVWYDHTLKLNSR